MSPRRYYPRRRNYNKQRYSVENIVKDLLVDVDTTATTIYQRQGIQDVVPADFSNIPRKVSHIHLHFDQDNFNFVWALVYVPASYSPNFLGLTSDSPNLYNPNQFLMGSGYVNANTAGGQNNFTVPLKRILHSGDNIRLIIAADTISTPTLTFAARYAICAL